MYLKAGFTLFLIFLLTIVTFNTSTVVARPSTIKVPHDYSTIQEAIDAASSADTIVVSEGLYAEGQINVTKPLTLMAEGEVIVDGLLRGRATFWVESDSVTIKGFTIINASSAGIYLLHDNSRIEENTLTNNNRGIDISGYNNIVRGNKIINNQRGIIINGRFNHIDKNVIANNYFFGISLWHADYNTIKENVIKNTLGDYGGAILLGFSEENLVADNTIINTECWGIWVSFSYSNIVTKNKLAANKRIGIYLDVSRGNTVKENEATDNGYGITLGHSSNNVVRENIVKRNAHSGISVVGYSSHNSLKENVALQSNEFDLYWDGTGIDNVWTENKYRTKNW